MVICITQPRRVAAVTVATRVAEERAAVLGHEVRKPDVSRIELLLFKKKTRNESRDGENCFHV